MNKKQIYYLVLNKQKQNKKNKCRPRINGSGELIGQLHIPFELYFFINIC